jgi:hypothetical protein
MVGNIIFQSELRNRKKTSKIVRIRESKEGGTGFKVLRFFGKIKKGRTIMRKS